MRLWFSVFSLLILVTYYIDYLIIMKLLPFSGTSACVGHVATAAVVCSVVFYIGGVVSGLLIYLAITRCKETRKQVAIISSGRSEAPNTAAPVYVYEDIAPTPGREQAGIELQENVAYGPVKK